MATSISYLMLHYSRYCSLPFHTFSYNTSSIASTIASFRIRSILAKFTRGRHYCINTPPALNIAASLIDQFGNFSLGHNNVSKLKELLDTRRSGYRGEATYSFKAHVSGGFVATVSFTDLIHTYLVKSPEGMTFPQKKLAKQAVAKVAFELLKAREKPPILQPELDKSSLVEECHTLSDAARIEKLSEITGHGFRDRNLALRALRHASAGERNNQTLAFLGDAAIGYYTARRVYMASPEAEKVGLHHKRGDMVENEEFERISNKIGMTDLMEVGSGMSRSLVCGKMVADMFEAVIAALDLEGGQEVVLKFWDKCV